MFFLMLLLIHPSLVLEKLIRFSSLPAQAERREWCYMAPLLQAAPRPDSQPCSLDHPFRVRFRCVELLATALV